MEITSLGHSSFKIRGKHAVIVTDPFNPEVVDLKFPQVSADIVTVSHQHEGHNFVSRIQGNPVVIAGPGEYEIKGVRIIGVMTHHGTLKGDKRGKNTAYRIAMEGIALIHCGDLGEKLDDEKMEKLNSVDLLMIPVGGVSTISAKEAAEVVHRLEPRIVIPMHYKTAGTNQNNFGELATVDVFLKEMGKEGVTSQPRLTVTKDKLPAETTVVILE